MKVIKILALITLIILTGVFLFWDDLTNLHFKLFFKLPQIENELTNFFTETIEKQIATPEPLRAKEEAPGSSLTKAGVIAFTNSQRQKFGLPSLKENLKLDESAELKVQDMLKNQYFAHDSPFGITVGDLADNVGYQFLAIGENLALGNFENDKVLVENWMDSPGHRANILNTRYREIGVAVLKGVFEGRTTWWAVQHFGLSLSVCPAPEESVKLTIDINQSKLNEISAGLAVLEAEIKSMRPRRGPIYQQKVEEYNQLVAQYNLLVGQTKAVIDDYNNQVKAFNECLLGI